MSTNTFTSEAIPSQGQQTSAQSLPVVIASDQSSIPITGTITVTEASIGPTGSPVPLSANYVAGKNAGNLVGLAVDSSGNIVVSSIVAALPAGSNAIGTVTVGNASLAVTGTFFQATQPVSGTVSANQSGTWTVQPGNTANTTPWLSTISQGGNSAAVSASNALKVDGSAVTQPVSGTVTVNAGSGTFTVSGTVTANAGTNLNTSALALDTSVNGLLLSQGSTTSGQKGPLHLGAVTTGAPSYTTAQSSPLSLTTAGALRVDGSAVTQPISGTVTANNSANGTTGGTAPGAATQVGGVNSGNLIALSVDSSGRANIGAINSALPAGANSIGTVVLGAGAAAIGSVSVTGTVAVTESGTWTVQPGNTANTTPWLATIAQGGNSATVSAGGALKVDGSAVTQPISVAGTVAVTQSGTWTVATNGDGSASGGTAATKSLLSGGIYNSSAPTLTNGQQASLQLNASGALITSSTAPTTSSATFQDGSIAFGSLTTSFATVITTGGSMRHIDLTNGTNATVVVSLNGGSTTSYTLDAGTVVSLDLNSNGANIATSTALQAKYTGSAPTSGNIRINGFY